MPLPMALNADEAGNPASGGVVKFLIQ